MQESKMATNNYNNKGNNNYTYYNNNSTLQMSSQPSQPVSLSDVQLFLNKFYFRLINGEQISLSQSLPVMNNILSEMRNIVMFVSEVDVDQKEDLWWDENHQYLVYDDSECSSQESSHQDEHSIHFSSSSSSYDDSSFISSDSNSSLSQLDEEIRVLEDEIFIDSMLNFIDVVAPKSIFNRRKSRRRKNKRTRKLIDPHLRNIWSNSAEVMAPVSSNSEASFKYPIIDFSKVNKRFVDNIPKPDLFPVLGCSKYPDVKEDPAYIHPSRPFGHEPGYMTDQGIIAVPDKLLVHGYVWKKEVGWMLHAQYPKEERRSREKGSISRRKKRKKELR